MTKQKRNLVYMYFLYFRYLKDNKYVVSIMRGKDFESSKRVLEGKARYLRQQGKGKVPNRARSLNAEEEEVLWTSGQLGDSTPRSLIQTVWWYKCLHFGMRGREQHYDLKIEDFPKIIKEVENLKGMNVTIPYKEEVLKH